MSLAAAIESATWRIQKVLEARGYPRIRLEASTYPKSLMKLVTESDSGIRIEVYFPLPLDIERIIEWCSQLPYPPCVDLLHLDSGVIDV